MKPNVRIYQTLIDKDPNFKRWYNNMKHASIVTAEGALRRIGRVCTLFDTTPAKLARMSGKDATDFLMDLVTRLDEDELQPTTIKHSVEILKSWFRHNGINITEKVKIPKRAKKASKVANEQSPTPDQVRRVLNAADQKQKVECALVGLAGLRLETVGDYLGKDGLKLKDLPELEIDNTTKKVTFSKIPTLIIVRPNLSKAAHQYLTFAPEEACEYIAELLEHRMINGEKLTPESPVVTSLKWHNEAVKKKSIGHITSRRVGTSMKKAITDAGFSWRPYILRTFFDTRLMIAEADGLIIRDWRVFHMGHSGDIEAVYTVNKGRLPEDLIEKMRSAYGKAADKCLVTFKKHDLSMDAVKAQFNRQFLEMAGYGEDEINKLGDLGRFTAEEVKKLLRESSKKELGLNGNSQKVVAVDRVESFIADGWEYVKDLPGGKAIIKLPNGH